MYIKYIHEQHVKQLRTHGSRKIFVLHVAMKNKEGHYFYSNTIFYYFCQKMIHRDRAKWNQIYINPIVGLFLDARVIVRSGVTSERPLVANLTSTTNSSIPMTTQYEGRHGFYIRLQGFITSMDLISMVFAAFNRVKSGTV